MFIVTEYAALMCPALDVRQPVRNKKRKEYNSHTNLRSKKKTGPILS